LQPNTTNKRGPNTGGFENVGKTVLCGKAKRSKKEHGEPEAKERMRMKQQTTKLK
jgi:hypothetical protein